MNIICKSDCLTTLKRLADGSFNFCFTDPPYNVNKDYIGYKDNLEDAEYLAWIEAVLAELKRVTNNRLAIYVPQKHIADFWHILGSDYRQIVLSYSPAGALRWGFSNQFASILTNVKPIKKIPNVWHNCQMPALGYFFREQNFDHPGYTSLDITSRVILNFTSEGETVLDPFGGTGTTGLVCLKNNRKFLLIERETEYIEIAKDRFSQKLLLNTDSEPVQFLDDVQFLKVLERQGVQPFT